MHSIVGFKTIIGTQKCVYRHSSAGKLEKNSLVRTMLFPHQQGFDSDSKACFPVTIDNLPTFAFEQGIVAAMPISQSTAMATPLACVVGINNIKSNLLVKASGFKQLLKRIEWDTHNLFVKPFSFWRKAFKVFNRNTSIKLQSHTGYLPDNLSKPVFDKVVFPYFKFFKRLLCFMASFVSKRLQPFLSFKYLFSLNPKVFAKVSLFQNLSVGGKDRNGKALAVDVYPKNIFPLRQFSFLFRKISNNLTVSDKPISLAEPTASNKRTISLKTPIPLDWNSQPLLWIHPELNKEVGFGFKDLAVSWNVEFDSNLPDGGCLASGNISFNITDNLRTKRGVFLAG